MKKIQEKEIVHVLDSDVWIELIEHYPKICVVCEEEGAGNGLTASRTEAVFSKGSPMPPEA